MSPEIEEILQQTLDRIEENLKNPIVPEDLSRAAGFSHYHFCRVFKAAMGVSLMRYITGRRLIHGLYHMWLGREKTEAALMFGFDSYAGFYKAFRRMFGASPTAHLRTHRAAAPARVNLKERGEMMELELVKQALACWGLQDASVEAVCYPNTGRLSENAFLVDNRFVLKCSRSPGSVQGQAKLQRTLHAHGLAAAVLPIHTGADFARVGEWDCLLMERLEGKPVNAAQLLAQPEGGAALGEGLARLHAALRECDPLLCSEEKIMDTLQYWAAPLLRQNAAVDQDWLEKWLSHAQEVFADLPVQIIHRDPNPDNVLMAQGRVTGFLDFELSRIAPRIFDLAYAATGILSVSFAQAGQDAGSRFAALAKAVWRGYHAHSPLSEKEQRALPDMVIAIQLICIAAFTGSDTYAVLAQTNKQMLEGILSAEEQLRQPFC
ncbi:MAG: phosphotransferase [Clostridia bacterium]|nr:phosphotransferase [Clostridia bacterium]